MSGEQQQARTRWHTTLILAPMSPFQMTLVGILRRRQAMRFGIQMAIPSSLTIPSITAVLALPFLAF